MRANSDLRCLVLNAGGTKLADKPAAEQWAAVTAAAADRPDVAFIQEVPSDAWLGQWRAQGYRVLLGHLRGWTVRSALVTLLDDGLCVPVGPRDIPERATTVSTSRRPVSWVGAATGET